MGEGEIAHRALNDDAQLYTSGHGMRDDPTYNLRIASSMFNVLICHSPSLCEIKLKQRYVENWVKSDQSREGSKGTPWRTPPPHRRSGRNSGARATPTRNSAKGYVSDGRIVDPSG